MSEDRNGLVRDLLEILEREETKLLSWGVVDIGFTADEVDQYAQAVIDDADAALAPIDLRQELFDRGHLFAFRESGHELLRTRMAEAVRLFAKLRQLFPRRPWQFAPTLVADFRFARRPRRYPSRVISPAKVIERITADVRLTPLRQEALAALLRTGDKSVLCLAEFQVQAIRRMLLDLEARISRGLIIGAGTGTGKTLAFYIPALTHLAGLLERDIFWTKAVAIYPRNELLKDQLSETYSEARRLDAVLLAAGKRKLTLGTFFGPTPRDAAELRRREVWGPQRSGGYICPFLRCPNCDGELVWLIADLDSSAERLHCASARCTTVIGDDEIVLTRNRLARTPADVLFTTTEMLNRRMGDNQFGHVFGLGPNVRRPQLMLLDEVHTYSGTSGAQVALLLRRWQIALGTKVQFTGLSATLRGATDFFGQLVGLRPGTVEEVSPRESELDPTPESVEYVLALRGDPVSGTSLLSTSIQTAMLLRRILDPMGADPSRGLYGKRVFLFTDDLDVTNRLYNNLQDAEGLDSWNRPVLGQPPLAALRSPAASLDNALRMPAGQSWQICEDLGHPPGLAQPLRLSRTSSQDTGVNQDSDVVVATAALEVGYNDPEVGAVMQHKAPQDWAAFLQRKGRAGRRREMRPWTAVVLSDYGRDRVAYQAYDQIFDPELPFRSLPVGNRYVLRMQAAFTLMDWVAHELPPGSPKGSIWADWSSPETGTGFYSDNRRTRQAEAVQILGQVLDGIESRCRSLEAYIQSALGLTRDETHAVLWDPPRPLMTAVIPTILRRLESGWHRVQAHPSEPTLDYQLRDHPLPDFVPQQLFGDLNLPEVEIILDQPQGQDPESIFMPLVQAVRMLAPGRVTRRFGYRHAFSHHWVAPPDLHTPVQNLAVESYCEEFEEGGRVQIFEAGGIRDIRCVRPWKLHPRQPPGNVAITSNAFLDWRSQIAPSREDDRLRFETPRGSAWESVIDEIRFYTHNHRNHARVRRFAIASRASVLFRNGNQADLTVHFMNRDSKEPAAVGFAQEVDGISIRFRIPADLGLDMSHPNQRKVRAFRTAYFWERVKNDPTLILFANPFQREWLGQVYLSSLVRHALEHQKNLESANYSLQLSNIAETMEHVLTVIFQPIELPGGIEQRQRLHSALSDLCRNTMVTAALGACAAVLWSAPDEGSRNWAAARYKATLGGAILEACQQTCPQMEAGDLYLDLEPGPRPPDAPPLPDGVEEIWITEATIGGGGVLEEVLRAYVTDPRRFFRIAESALAATDFEIVDRELTRLLVLAETDSEVTSLLADVRSAESHAALAHAVLALRRMLAKRGIVVTHPVMSAIHTRILRPGSSPASDRLLGRTAALWTKTELNLGIELDPRVYAYIAAESPDVQEDLGAIGEVLVGVPFWRFQTVYGILWPRGYQVRAQGLSAYNPFADSPAPDREILLDLLHAREPVVSLESGWEGTLTATLNARGTARLVAPPKDRTALKEALLKLAAEPLEVGFLHLHPNVVSITQDSDCTVVTLDLREVLL